MRPIPEQKKQAADEAAARRKAADAAKAVLIQAQQNEQEAQPRGATPPRRTLADVAAREEVGRRCFRERREPGDGGHDSIRGGRQAAQGGGGKSKAMAERAGMSEAEKAAG